MNKFNVSLTGLSPYLQHRMDDISLADWEKQRQVIIERAEISQTDAHRAEYHCYRNKGGQCYIPADHIRGSLIDAGTFVKAKVGARTKSMKSIIAATFIIEPDEILLPDWLEIDKRSAVNKNIKGRVIVIRPKWSEWNVDFVLNCYEPTITIEMIKQVFYYAGSYVGIGSFRPTNNGRFGRYEFTNLMKV